jgi:iron complex outermembrane recepter protein
MNQLIRLQGGLGFVLMASLAISTTTVLAQAQTVTTSASDQDALPEITVTGSRIRKDEYTSAAPVQVITAERSTLEGLSDTAQVLQQSTVASGSGQINTTFSGFVVDGGPGVQTLSIRGLGAQRTLVLLNGRRLPPAGVGGTVGPVDLNIIPDSIVSRIELLKDGASSIYGSDAVAGVANIITRTRADGGQVGGQLSNLRSGGDQFTLDGRYGWSSDRGGASLSLEWYRREALAVGKRDFARCQQDVFFAPEDTTVGGIGAYAIAPRDVVAGGRTDAIDPRTGQFKCFTGGNAAGYVLTYSPVTGAFIGTRTNIAPLPNNPFLGAQNNPAPGWRFIPFEERNFDDPRNLEEDLIPYANRATLFAQADYRPEMLGGAELYTELLANRRTSRQVSRRTFFPDVSNLSSINPFNGSAGPARLSQPNVIMPFDAEQTVSVWRVLAGVRGDVKSGFFDNWRYDVYGSHSRNDADYSRIVIPNANVEAGTGTLQDGSFDFIGVCQPGAPTGCVPLNGLFTVGGLQHSNFSPQELAYLLAKDKGNTKYDQTIVEAQITGDLFTMPAGSAAIAVGATYRNDKINDVPGEFSRNANSWGAITAAITKGSDTVKEVYAELELPLLRGKTLARDLSLNVSGRLSDYDSVGNASTYKFGVNWKLNDLLRFRGTYGTSFRAPALFELYLANQTSFLSQSSVDPCTNYGDPERPKAVVIQTNCAADGIPPDYQAFGSSAQILTGGGLGRLKPEDSQALSVGLVVTPPGTGFSVAVDYFDIKVTQQVGSFSSGTVGACYSDPRFRTISGFCDLFTRDLDPESPRYLEILQIDASYRNIPNQRTKGFDLNASYERSMSFGKLEVEGEATYTTYDTTELFAGRVLDTNGLVGEPKLVADVQSRLRKGDWTFAWTVNYTGGGQNLGFEEEEGQYGLFYSGLANIITGASSVMTHDLSIRYRGDKFEVTGGVTNVLGRLPPLVSNSDAPGSIQRVGNAPLSSQYLSLYEGRGAFLTLSRRF